MLRLVLSLGRELSEKTSASELGLSVHPEDCDQPAGDVGIPLLDRIGDWFPRIAGGALVIFGLYYIFLQLSGAGYGHSHLFRSRSHQGTTPHLQVHSGRSNIGPRGGNLIDTGDGLMELLL